MLPPLIPRPSLLRLSAAVPRAGGLGLFLLFSGCGGEELRLGEAQRLWLMWLVPLLAIFFALSAAAAGKRLQRFAEAPTLKRLAQRVSCGKRIFKALLLLLAVSALILTLARPQWGFTWEEVRRQGVDVVVAVDVSDSMLVRDVSSSGTLDRLQRAKREIVDLLQILDGDRVGIVAFAGSAFLQCPLTLDYAAAEIFLDAVDSDSIPVKGTNLAAALETSLDAFRGAGHPSRAIILITDGEDHSGRALQAARRAAEEEVRIFTIGIGRDEGAPIPDPRGGFRRDRSGSIVLSKLDESTLQQIALDTGGSYVRSVTGDVDLEQIYTQGIKAVLEDQELESQQRRRWHERFQWTLLFAIACLMLESLISDRRRGPGLGPRQDQGR
ncbi:MAG: VWA domain-containing protein [Acidobacteriota bacterium]